MLMMLCGVGSLSTEMIGLVKVCRVVLQVTCACVANWMSMFSFGADKWTEYVGLLKQNTTPGLFLMKIQTYNMVKKSHFA